MNNIFLEPFAGDHELVPFDKISVRDFEIAISDAIDVHNCEIEQITGQTDAPSFQNTIVALERSGQMLGRVLGVFYPMLSANADDELMEIAYRMAPQITEHENSIILNQALWRRVKAVHDHEEASTLSDEDRMLLDKTYRAFVRQGADLEGEDRQRYRQLTGKLTKLTLKYDRNLLHEMASAQMWLTADDLTGLPATAIDAAAQQAREKGRDGEYLITLQAPSYVPFMRYSQRRDLRERLYRLYDTQCSQGDYDNTRILRQIANTRLAIAQLLGYATFADYRLTTTMAQDKEHVYDMLERLRQAYQPVQKADMNRLERFASEVEGHDVRIMPWDYSYYANRLRDHLFNINDEMLRPYFELSRVTRGVFGLATRLYGLQFTQNIEAPVYHPEVKVYDVTDADGTYMGTLYTDFFPRATKQSGAWMTNFAEQWVDADGHDHRPLVSLNMNFTRPTDTQPSLLTPSEVRTFLHEFGHAGTLRKFVGDQRVPRFRGNAIAIQREFPLRTRVPRQFCAPLPHRRTGSPATGRQPDCRIAVRGGLRVYPSARFRLSRHGLAHHHPPHAHRCDTVRAKSPASRASFRTRGGMCYIDAFLPHFLRRIRCWLLWLQMGRSARCRCVRDVSRAGNL